jgi:hypothetical protein
VDFDSLNAADLAWLQEHEALISPLRSPKREVSDPYPGTTHGWEEAYWRTLVANISIKNRRRLNIVRMNCEE